MIGSTFWDDMGIDAYEIQLAIEAQAKTLVDHWGKELTETDLLKLKAYSDSQNNPIEAAFAQTEGRLFGRRFPFSSSDDSKNTTQRAFRRPFLVGLRNTTRIISFVRGGSE